MTFSKRKANWLPLPKSAKSLVPVEAGFEVQSKLSIGEIVRFLPNLGIGKVKTKLDSIIPFSFAEIGKSSLNLNSFKVGSKVGFDVCNTENGKRITKLKSL